MKSEITTPVTAHANSVAVTINTSTVKHSSTGGFGFQLDPFFWRSDNRSAGIGQQEIDSVIEKRWKELNPGFARVYVGISWWESTEGTKTWDSEQMQALYKELDILHSAGTEVFLTHWYHAVTPAWLGGGYEITDDATRQKFAGTVVDALDYLINIRGYTGIKYFSIANELQNCSESGNFNLDSFKAQNQKIMDELNSRGKTGLFEIAATDQYSITGWNANVWASENMDHLVGIYDGHTYKGDGNSLNDYGNIKADLDAGVSTARGRNKSFILGEFGCDPIGGGTFVNPHRNEASYGILLAEYAIAALNSGTYAISNWTFFDLMYSDEGSIMMKWGLFSDAANGFSTRPAYYAYGLFTKYFRPNSMSFEVTANDKNIRAGAARNNLNNKYSIAVVNRNGTDTAITYTIQDDPIAATLRKYIYNPSSLPANVCGDLQSYSSTVNVTNGKFTDTVPAGCLVVYTGDYDSMLPAGVSGFAANAQTYDSINLTWNSNAEGNFCYYRIYRSISSDFTPSISNQIASTIAGTYLDKSLTGSTIYYYMISAVDKYGNVSGYSSANASI